MRGDITLRPETQEDVHSLFIVADDEESLVAMIMRATPIINVNELCIVDFVDLKMEKQSKLFIAKPGSEQFYLLMSELFSIKFRAFLMIKTNEAFACLHNRHLIHFP